MKTRLNRIIGISLWLLIGAMVSCPMVVAGGIDVIWVEDGWNISTVPLSVDTNYVAITGDGLTPFQNLYAARADGGIDEFYVDNGWNKATLSPGGNPLTTSYVDLAADASAAQMIYGLRASGGIDIIYVDNGWQIGLVPRSADTNYVAITGDGLTPFQNLYAARADGGIDEFYVDNGWNKATLLPGGNPLTISYIDLAADVSASQMIYALRKDNPPTVDIKSPASGATIWPPSKVTVTVVVDDEGIVSLKATVDGAEAEIEEELVNDDGSIDLVVHLPKEARGTYTDGRNLLVKITATDSSGKTGSDDVNIFVPHDMRNKMGNYPK